MSIPKHINGSPFTTLGGIIKLLYCYVSFLKHFDLFVALCSCFSVKIFLTLPIQLNRQRFNPHSWGLFDVTRGGVIVPTVCEFLKVHEELRKVIKQDVVRTFPEVEFFQSLGVRETLIDILFMYARCHPEIGYRQVTLRYPQRCLLPIFVLGYARVIGTFILCS